MDSSVPTFVPEESNEEVQLQRRASKASRASEPTIPNDIEKTYSASGDKPVAPEHDESGLLTGARLYLVFLSMMLAIFVSARFDGHVIRLTIRCSPWTSLSSPPLSPSSCPTSTPLTRSPGSSPLTSVSISTMDLIVSADM